MAINWMIKRFWQAACWLDVQWCAISQVTAEKIDRVFDRINHLIDDEVVESSGESEVLEFLKMVILVMVGICIIAWGAATM